MTQSAFRSSIHISDRISVCLSVYFYLPRLNKQGGHWGDSGWIRHKLVLEVDWQKKLKQICSRGEYVPNFTIVFLFSRGR